MTKTLTKSSMNSSKMNRHLNTMKSHSALVERVRKSLYYGSTHCGSHELIDCPSMPLTEVTVHLFEKTVTSGTKGLDVFDMNFASNVSQKASISPTSIMLSMIYLERLKRKNPEYLRRVSPCDLFIVSIMVASKFLFDDGEDEEVFNDEWANSGNIDVKQLNRLEREFLAAIDWSLYVDCNTFMKQLSKVEALISLDQSLKRGGNGMTYNELLSLFNYSLGKNKNDKLWSIIMTNITKVVLVSTFAYWATVFAIISSTTITKNSIENIENTHSISNNSIECNNSGLIYNTGLEKRVSELNSYEIPINIYSVKKDKTGNVLFIENVVHLKTYKKMSSNIEISRKKCSEHNLMPNKYQFEYIYKY